MSESKNIYSIPENAPILSTGSDWIKKRRVDFKTAFNDSPLPRRGLHLWRYTDPEKFLPNDQGIVKDLLIKDSDTVNDSLKSLAEGKISCLIIDHGGREITIHQSDSLKATGIIINPLSEALESQSELVEKHLYKLVGADSGKFEALNGAMWQEGVFIYLPDNKTIEKPIHIIRESGYSDQNTFLRLLVVGGKNSEFKIIDEYCSIENNSKKNNLTNSSVEIFGGADSRLTYLSLQRQDENSNFYLTHRTEVARGGQVVTIPLVFGASLSKQNFGANLAGAGAHSDIFGLLFGTGHQEFDNHTLHHHASGNTTSNIDFKVVLTDRSRSAYTGLIRIDNEAKGCEAYQENRNLLLSPKAKAETIPELEILNEDVSCSHGATVGPIDPQTIFYLKSRGIVEKEAIRMVISGFVATTLKLVAADLREKVESFVSERLTRI